MTDTPETDAANARGVGYALRFYAMKTHARKLERERDEYRKLADDAVATLHEIKVKYGLGERHVMREKDREIEKLRKTIDELEILASWPG